MNNRYVYTLAYPDGKVFYVGKGTGDRIFDHEREAGQGKQTEKCRVIRQIWASGNEVVKTKVQENMADEVAYRLEKDLISMYGREHLTNMDNGGIGGARPGAGRPSMGKTVYLGIDMPIDMVAQLDARVAQAKMAGIKMTRNDLIRQILAKEMQEYQFSKKMETGI